MKMVDWKTVSKNIQAKLSSKLDWSLRGHKINYKEFLPVLLCANAASLHCLVFSHESDL